MHVRVKAILRTLVAAVALLPTGVTACANDEASTHPPVVVSAPSTSATATAMTAADATTTAAPTTIAAAGPLSKCGWHGIAPDAMYEHVLWIWFENHTDRQVIGSRSAPFMTS